MTLLELAEIQFSATSQGVHFTGYDLADNFLNDLAGFPHAFVLACLMDRQIKAERAWWIPFEIKERWGCFEIDFLAAKELDDYKSIFNQMSLHRFNNLMADVFYSAIQHIKNNYDGNASLIWNNNPSSSLVVYRFIEFKGAGIKIATMAGNILARQFRVPFSDFYSIDISPDIHVKRVMKRMGYVPLSANNEMIIYKARELSPKFPGVIDFSCWEIGRNWCRPKKPNCAECVVAKACKKVL